MEFLFAGSEVLASPKVIGLAVSSRVTYVGNTAAVVRAEWVSLVGSSKVCQGTTSLGRRF